MEDQVLQSVRELLPSKAIERLQLSLGNDFQRTLQSFLEERKITFRVNTLRASAKNVLAQLDKENLKYESIPWCPSGYVLESGTMRELQSLDAYGAGAIYIQEASSMLASHILQVEPGMSVLDLCAAPGSKTSLISMLMNNTGTLVANDRSRTRLYRLRSIIKHQGVENAEVICSPGEELGKTYSDCFDRVLVDVPCSGEGRFRIDRPLRMLNWSEREIKKLAKLQAQLLSSAFRCVKVGGLIVYSTCTFAVEENEFVIDKVISKKTISAELVEIPTLFVPESARPGINCWNGKQCKTDTKFSMRLVPDAISTGFFIALLRRTA